MQVQKSSWLHVHVSWHSISKGPGWNQLFGPQVQSVQSGVYSKVAFVTFEDDLFGLLTGDATHLALLGLSAAFNTFICDNSNFLNQIN